MSAPGAEGSGWRQTGPDEVVYRGFLTVVRRPLRLPDGRETTWDLIDMPAGVTVLPLTQTGNVVVVEQFRAGPMRLITSLPGGLVDAGESLEDAAVRELREETGYRCESVEIVASAPRPSHTELHYAAIARGCSRAHDQQLDEFEDCRVFELSLQQFRASLRAGEFTATDLTYLALDHAGLL